jgi:hypothetical protein
MFLNISNIDRWKERIILKHLLTEHVEHMALPLECQLPVRGNFGVTGAADGQEASTSSQTSKVVMIKEANYSLCF